MGAKSSGSSESPRRRTTTRVSAAAHATGLPVPILSPIKVIRSAPRAVGGVGLEAESRAEIGVGSVPVETELGETLAKGALPPNRLRRGVGEVVCPPSEGRALAPLTTHA
jgi:hypothetical protein